MTSRAPTSLPLPLSAADRARLAREAGAAKSRSALESAACRAWAAYRREPTADRKAAAKAAQAAVDALYV